MYLQMYLMEVTELQHSRLIWDSNMRDKTGL